VVAAAYSPYALRRLAVLLAAPDADGLAAGVTALLDQLK